MDLQTRKLQLIEDFLAISDEQVIEKLESVIRDEFAPLNPILKTKLTYRALKADEDIKEGRVMDRKEFEQKLNIRS